MKKYLIIISMSIFLVLFSCEKRDDNLKNINVYSRDNYSGARFTFLEKIGFNPLKSNDEILKNGFVEVVSNNDMITKIKNDPYSIGYISYVSKEQDMKVLEVNYITPSLENIITNKYPLQRKIYALMTNRTISDSKKQIIEAYFDFLLNTYESYNIINEYGGIKSKEKLKLWDETKINHKICQKNQEQETLKIGGATSFLDISQKIKNEFQSKCGNINILIDHQGSTDGYNKTVGKNKNDDLNLDISFLSRDLTKEEKKMASIVLMEVAVDAILVCVNQQNNFIKSISLNNLNKIYRGEISFW